MQNDMHTFAELSSSTLPAVDTWPPSSGIEGALSMFTDMFIALGAVSSPLSRPSTTEAVPCCEIDTASLRWLVSGTGVVPDFE